ncbi:MAG: dUTP diphosphatase [Spirochaetaceae bacterium]|nr:dUTP diphosphatase [Spirochaetaceae bacterium]
MKRTSQKTELPSYQTEGAAGMDLCAFLQAPLTIKGKNIALIPTGLSFEIPQGYEAQVRPRSGLALKHGITVLNSPGTIDSDYRGELKVILINLSDTEWTLENGDRIAQIVFSPLVKVSLQECTELSQTERSGKGFGSTGL